jgi:hypothetical protein
MLDTESVAELQQSVDELRDEVQILRTAIDELREVIEWISRNPEPAIEQIQQVRRIISMPLDPTCSDFGERINAFPKADLIAPKTAPPSQGAKHVQQSLLSDDQ